MRRPTPYEKTSGKKSRGFYLHWAGLDIRLDRDEKTAWEMYDQLKAGNPFLRDGRYWAIVGGKLVDLGRDQDEAAQALKAGPDPRDKNPPVVDVLDWYIEWHRKNGSAPGTIDFYAGTLKSFRAWIAGKNLRVRDLEVQHVEDWFAECHRFHKRTVALRDEAGNKVRDKRGKNGRWTYKQTTRSEPVSDTTKHNLFRGVKAAFTAAYKKGAVDFEALRGLEKPTQSKGKKVIPADDWQTILAAVQDDEFRDVLELLWETGMRPDEVRRAEARHFDRERRCLIFPWKEAKGRRRSKKDRVILLNDRAFQIVGTLALKRPSGNLFLNADGQPWVKNALTHRCTAHSKACGVKFTSYQFRHTWATRAHAVGIDQKSAAELMGHRDTTMVNQVYTHPSDETLRKELRKLG